MIAGGDILDDLHARGVSLAIEGDRLRARGELTDADRALVRSHRRDLVVELSWPLARREAWVTPVRHLADLPRATTLVCRVPGITAGVWFTTSRTAHEGAKSAGALAWSPTEYEALVVAGEAQKAHASDLREWCERKLREPAWKLTTRIALSGFEPARGRPPEDTGAWFVGGVGPAHRLRWGWSWGAFLTHFGCDLVELAVDEPPDSARARVLQTAPAQPSKPAPVPFAEPPRTPSAKPARAQSTKPSKASKAAKAAAKNQGQGSLFGSNEGTHGR